MFGRASLFVALWVFLGLAITGAMQLDGGGRPETEVAGAAIYAIGLWALLTGRVPWAIRWAVTVGVGGVLTTIAALGDGGASLISFFASWALSITSGYVITATILWATPVVIVMWPIFGARAAAWLATVPVTSLLVTTIFSIPLVQDLLYSTGREVEYVAMIAAGTRALIESLGLLWISKGAVLGASVARRFPEPGRAVRFRDE
jgi:hypothetical protein